MSAPDNGEFELIERLIEGLPASGPRVRLGPGDDAAVTEPGGATATTVDGFVEDVHFTLPEFPPEAVGRKALAATLSDLAAMGAEAGEAYAIVGLPDYLDPGFAERMHAGMAEVAARHGVELLGGDVSRAPLLVLGMTAVGHEPAETRFVPRSGATAGQRVVVTGELGGAAAGLMLLSGEGDVPEAAALRDRQLDPAPRLAEGLALAAAGAGAMIDISDGLGADSGHIARASGVRIEIELGRLPVQPGVEELAGSPEAALELAASGGEDFELLACLPAEHLEAASKAVLEAGGRLTEIGEVTDGEGVSLRMPDGSELKPRGYDHLDQ